MYDLTEAVEAAGEESTTPCGLCQYSTDGVTLCGPCRDEVERMLTAALPYLEQQIAAEAWEEGYRSGHSRAMRQMSDEPAVGPGINPYRTHNRKDN